MTRFGNLASSRKQFGCQWVSTQLPYGLAQVEDTSAHSGHLIQVNIA